jgi:hypothetical protein
MTGLPFASASLLVCRIKQTTAMPRYRDCTGNREKKSYLKRVL